MFLLLKTFQHPSFVKMNRSNHALRSNLVIAFSTLNTVAGKYSRKTMQINRVKKCEKITTMLSKCQKEVKMLKQLENAINCKTC